MWRSVVSPPFDFLRYLGLQPRNQSRQATMSLITPGERHQREVFQASTAVKRASSTWSSRPFWIRMENEWNYNLQSSLKELYRHYKEVAREALAWDQSHNDGDWQRKRAWIWTFTKFWASDLALSQSSVWKPRKPLHLRPQVHIVAEVGGDNQANEWQVSGGSSCRRWSWWRNHGQLTARRGRQQGQDMKEGGNTIIHITNLPVSTSDDSTRLKRPCSVSYREIWWRRSCFFFLAPEIQTHLLSLSRALQKEIILLSSCVHGLNGKIVFWCIMCAEISFIASPIVKIKK